jgi:hypothetical protein
MIEYFPCKRVVEGEDIDIWKWVGGAYGAI